MDALLDLTALWLVEHPWTAAILIAALWVGVGLIFGDPR